MQKSPQNSDKQPGETNRIAYMAFVIDENRLLHECLTHVLVKFREDPGTWCVIELHARANYSNAKTRSAVRHFFYRLFSLALKAHQRVDENAPPSEEISETRLVSWQSDALWRTLIKRMWEAKRPDKISAASPDFAPFKHELLSSFFAFRGSKPRSTPSATDHRYIVWTGKRSLEDFRFCRPAVIEDLKLSRCHENENPFRREQRRLDPLAKHKHKVQSIDRLIPELDRGVFIEPERKSDLTLKDLLETNTPASAVRRSSDTAAVTGLLKQNNAHDHAVAPALLQYARAVAAEWHLFNPTALPNTPPIETVYRPRQLLDSRTSDGSLSNIPPVANRNHPEPENIPVMPAWFAGSEINLLTRLAQDASIRLGIRGDVGMGKSSLLRHLAYGLIEPLLQSEPEVPARLPVLIDLKHSPLSSIHQCIVDKIRECVPELPLSEDDPIRHFLLSPGTNLVLLIDGLDHVTDPSPFVDRLARDIESAFPECAAVWVGRNWAIERYLPRSFERAVLTPFNAQDVQTYVSEYFNDRGGDPDKSRRLIEAIGRQPELRNQLRSPLHLSVLCDSWQEREDYLATTEGLLLERAIRTLLKQRALNLKLIGHPEPFLRHLSAIAWEASNNAKDGWLADEIVVEIIQKMAGDHKYELVNQQPSVLFDRLKNFSGVLQCNRERITFILDSYREYLAGRWLALQSAGLIKEIFRAHAWDPTWQRILVFMAGRLWQHNPSLVTCLIEWLLNEHQSGQDDRFGWLLALAAQMVGASGSHANNREKELGHGILEAAVVLWKKQAVWNIDLGTIIMAVVGPLKVVLGDAAKRPIVNLIKDKSTTGSLEHFAIKAAGECECQSGAPILLALACDTSVEPNRRCTAMEALVSLRVDSAASALVELLQRPSDDDALAAATSGASLNSGRFIIAIAEILAKLRHRPALKPLTRLIDATDDAHRGLLLRCIARIDREHAIDLLDKRIRSRRREMPDRLNSLKILNDLQWPDKQQLLLSLYQRDSLNKPLRMVIGTYLLHYGNNENRSTVESLWKQSRDWEAIQYCQEHLPPMFVAQAAHQKILQLLKVRTGEAKSWNRLDLARLLSSNALIWRYVGQTERASLVKLYQHILTTIDEPLELRRTLLIWPWSPSDIWWLPNEILRSLRQVLHNGRDDEALRAAVAERLSCVGEIESTAENIAILIKLLDARLGAQLHRPAGSSDIDLEVAVSNVRLALCRVAPQRALELFQPWLLDAASIKLYETICGWFRGEYCDPTDTSDEFSVFGRRLDTLARLHGSSTDQTLGPPTDPPMEALSCPAYQAVWLAEDAEPYAWMSEVSKSADRIDSGEPRERWTLDEKGLEKEAMLWDEVGGLQLVVAMRILRARKEVLLRGAACLDNSDMLLGAQCFVAEVLGTRRILEAEDDLLRILSSSTAPLPLRGAAVRGLAHLATTRALQVLADTLRDSRAASQLRRTVAAAVGVLRVQALATEVRSLTLDCSTSLELRATTAAALAALERECDNALLLRVIHDQAMPVEIRAAVVRAGGGSTVICAPKTMALLAGQVTESPQLRAAAAAACIRQLSQEMSAPDAWKAIEQILRNTNSNTELEIRMALVYQMRHYPVEEAAAALANVVTTPDEPVSLRKASWKTLCTIASNAASQLVPAFYDRMRLLRHEVARAGLLDLGTMEAWQLLLDRGWDEDLSLNEKVAPSTLTIVEDQRKTLVEQHSLRLDPSLCPA